MSIMVTHNDLSSLNYQFVKTNGINLNVAIAGPADGNPVILLHGFPDASFGWEKQIAALVGAGFLVVAPDQRGYNLSDKPAGVSSYGMNTLVADILGLADALGIPQFNLAGHDFGAAVSWNLAASHPKRLKRLAILNVPHPQVMLNYLKTNGEQRRRSWYIFFFQLPMLPELGLRSANWRAMTSAMRVSFSEEELNQYRAMWSRPGTLTAMLNWYRNIFRSARTPNSPQQISVPSVIIWGKRDKHLLWPMADASLKFCENGRVVYFEDASHWVMQDKPEDVSRLLIAQFRM